VAKIPTEMLFDFKTIYKMYPRKEGKTKGFEILARSVTTNDEFELLRLATRRYSEKCLRENTEPKYILLFSTFAGRWKDYLPLEESRKSAPQESRGLLI
jgi:hypothetical protein